jgi:hypothetical protein
MTLHASVCGSSIRHFPGDDSGKRAEVTIVVRVSVDTRCSRARLRRFGYPRRMVTRALGIAVLFALSCSRPATPATTATRDGSIAAAECALAGQWKADLALYEGSASLTAQGPDAYAVVIEGKGTQAGQAHWDAKARQLQLDLAADSYRCAPSDDCRKLTCTGARGQTLDLARP